MYCMKTDVDDWLFDKCIIRYEIRHVTLPLGSSLWVFYFCFFVVLFLSGFVKSMERANRNIKNPPQISLNTFKLN